MAAPFFVRGGNGRWAVFQGNRKVSADFTQKDNAEEAMTRLERQARERSRPCLRCGTVFPSLGPHNRMCDPCRGRASAVA